MIAPLPFVWTGAAFEPVGRHARGECERAFGAGQIVRLVEHEERSEASHNHLFALIGDVHDSLTDEQRLIWPTPDALRKYCLCKAGCCDVATHVSASKAEALRLRAFLTANKLGDLIVADGNVVTVLTAWSLKKRAMGGRRFQEVKDKVLLALSDVCGAPVETLGRAAA